MIGTILGVITALQLAGSQPVHQWVMPLLVFTRAVPVLALAAALTLWFGYEIISVVTMTVLIIYSRYTSGFTMV